MPYHDIFSNDVYENEHDEEMTRKHPNYYKAIKTLFPEAYKLPEDEIKPMVNIMRNKGDTYEEAESLVKDYINQKTPMWNQEYLSDNKLFNPKSTDEWLRTINNPNQPLYHSIQEKFNAVRPKNIKVHPMDEVLATSLPARYTELILQGMADSSNDFSGGLVQKISGLNLRPIEPQNRYEKGLEKGGKMLYGLLARRAFKNSVELD